MLPYLVGKKAQAQLLKRFISSRLARKIPGKKNNGNIPYSRDELEALATLSELNGNQQGTSETIRAEISLRGL